jgi:hypothetical protein
MKGCMSIVLLIEFAIVASGVSAEPGPECIRKNKEYRWAVRGEFDRESGACKTEQCQKEASAKYRAESKKVEADKAACDSFLRSQQAAPQSPTQWKPGDPSPVAPDGRRYIMSCSGKVLGLYKPGGALEMELKTHPGNCFPNDNPWPGPGSGGTVVTDHCYEKGTGSWKEYSGGRPSWCDPNR